MKKSIFIIILTVLITGNAHSSRNDDINLFVKLDANRDGVLNKKEVYKNKNLVRFTNLYYPESFFKADINRDGLLDFKEYMANEEDIY